MNKIVRYLFQPANTSHRSITGKRKRTKAKAKMQSFFDRIDLYEIFEINNTIMMNYYYFSYDILSISNGEE